MSTVKRTRLGLALILLLFAAPFVVAWMLSASGWRPIGTRNYGELITPPEHLTDARFVLADGQVLKWKEAGWQWTIFALAGPDCAAGCMARIDELRRVRLTLNQNADRVRVVVIGAQIAAQALVALAPVRTASDLDGKLAALLPAAPDQIAAAFADPTGRLVLRYPVGYDGSSMRNDLARLIREGF